MNFHTGRINSGPIITNCKDPHQFSNFRIPKMERSSKKFLES